MAAPFDYSVPVANPLESSLGAFKTGLGMRNANVQQNKLESDIAYENQKRGQEAIDAQKAREAAIRLNNDLFALSSKKDATAEDYSAMMVKYPHLSEHFKRGWDVLDKAQQTDRLSGATQVYAAVNAGRTDIAVDLLTQRATALRNSGKEDDAKAAEAMSELIRFSPESAKTSVGLWLAGTMGPEKFAETFGKVEGERRSNDEHPAKIEKLTEEVKEQRAKAEKAAVDSRFAESKAAMDLVKNGWDITKIQEDIGISKENSRIAALNAQIGREANDLKRDELKLKRDDAVRKRDETLRTMAAETESARSTMDNFLNTADRILALTVDKDGKPTVLARATMGPVDSRMPTMQRDVADLEALIETFDAQAFLSQVPTMKGLGALSNAEGAKLGAALQSFSLKQTPQQFATNLKEAQRLILKARTNLAAKRGAPDTVPDTPAAAEADDIDALVDQYAPVNDRP